MRQDLTHASVEPPDRAGRTEPPLVRLRNISKNYGAVEAVKPLDLDIHRGDFFAILGHSGCGKTTLLRVIGGFIAPTSGSVEIGGAEVTRLGPEMRPTNMVFQGLGLFPHMTVRQNVGYGLRIAKQPRASIAERVRGVLALVRLEELGERQIKALSGGQQQRVALARALVMRPQVLLLDEPLAALDLKLRQAMQEELRRIHNSIGGTFVFVTHDQGEALGLANVVAVMDEGVLAQLGSPEEIYSAPKTQFVSTFIGEANVFVGTRVGGEVTLDLGRGSPRPGATDRCAWWCGPRRSRWLAISLTRRSFSRASCATWYSSGPTSDTRSCSVTAPRSSSTTPISACGRVSSWASRSASAGRSPPTG